MKRHYTALFIPILVFLNSNISAQTFFGQGGLLVPPGAPTQTVGITTSIATVSGVGIIGSGCVSIENVTIDFQHTFVGDVAIFLIGPGGQVLELSSGNGGAGDNFTNTVFTDNAPLFITAGTPPFTGTFRPEGRQTNTVPPFSNALPLGTYTFENTYNGTNADGDWTLLINDYVAVDWGTLSSWSITFTSGSGPVPVADAGPDQTICPGQSATLTATGTPGATNFLWSNGATTATTTVSPAVTTNYIVTVTNNGCTDTDTVTVFIGSSGGTVNAGPDVAICNGQPTTLTATGAPAGATFSWSNGQNGSSITVSPPATNTYTVTATSGGCNATDQVTVTVNPNPTANAGPDVNLCSGDITTLTATGGGTYSWSSGQTTAQITINPIVTTLYTVTVTLNGCTDTDDVLVNVTPSPVVDAGPDVAACSGATTVLTAIGGPGTFNWSTGASGQTITVSPASTQLYFVTVTDGNCTATDNVLVTVTAPVANAGNDQFICDGDNVALSATGGGSYLWSTGETSPLIFVNPAATTSYTVTVTDANGCTDSDEVLVNVTSATSANAGPDQSICEGGTAILTASGGTSYFWSNGQSGSTIQVAPSGTNSYAVTVSNALGCTATDEVVVIVLPSPLAEAGDDVSICAGEFAILQASGGNSYLWSSGQSSAVINVNPVSTTNYVVTVTDAAGCTDDDLVTVIVSQTPIANAGPDQSLCIGESTTLTASGGGTYLWSMGETTASILANPATTTNFTVTVTNAAGCTATDAVTVSINPLPTVNAGPNVSIAAGEDATLTATGSGTFVWSNGQSGSSITVSPAVTTTYTVTATLNGCTVTDDVTVFVNEPPQVDLGPDLTICAGETATLTAASSVSGNTTILWSNGETTPAITVSPVVTTTYSVTVTTTGLSSEDTMVVFVNNAPLAAPAILGDNVICSGTSVNYSINPVAGATTYLWSVPSGATIVSGQNTLSVSVDWGTAVSGNISVVASNACGDSPATDLAVQVNTPPPTPGPLTGALEPCAQGTAAYSVPLLPDATQYNWTLSGGPPITSGQGTTQIVIDWSNVAATQQLCVTAENACGNSAPLCEDITPTATPTLNAGSDDFSCGTSTTLSASGAGAWSLASGPGQANFTNENDPASQVAVTQAGAYSFAWTLDNNGCAAADTVAIVFYPNPMPNSLSEDCNSTNDAYTVSFNITGGQAPYSVNGSAIAGADFTSSTITSGDTYDFEITDANGCTAPLLSGVELCNCGSAAGSVSLTPLHVCEGGTATADYLGGETLDGNDILGFALHDGASPPNILALSLTPSFAYNPSLSFGVTYYISAVVANNDGSGLPDLTDPCLSLSQGVPVVFHALPTAVLSGDASLCPGECADLQVTFTGSVPFTWTYSNGSNNATLVSQVGTQNETICPGVTTNFTLLNISDAFCQNTASGTVTMTVAQGANPGVAAAPVQLCTGSGQLISLPTLLTGATSGGLWSETSAVPSSGGAFNPAAATFNPTGQAAGTYTFRYEVTAQAGCPTAASTVTVVINALPVAVAGGDQTLNCSVASAILGGPGTSTGAGITYLWSNGGNAVTNTVSQPGLYTLTVTTAAGCSATDAVNVSGDFAPPNAAISATGDFLTCATTSQTLDGSASTPAGLGFVWSLNGNTVGSTSNLTANQAACYLLTVTNPANGCMDTASYCLVLDTAPPTLSIATPAQLTCQNNSVTITATASAPNAAIAYDWTSGNGNIVGNTDVPNIVVDAQGNYQVVVTNTDNGCTASASANVGQDIMPPAAVASATEALDCNTLSTVLSGAGSATGAGFQYAWTTLNGQLSGSSSQLDASATAAGLYLLTVTNTVNGCTASDTAVVVSLTGNPSAIGISLASPLCFGECNGELALDDLGAGLQFALDGGVFSMQDKYENLCGGSYSLHVQDALGCEFDTLLIVSEPQEVFVNLHPDTTIWLGDSIRLYAVAPNSIASALWTPAETLGCDSCLKRWVRPLEATTYSVLVSDENGCTASDEQTVFVKKRPSVFVPNIFSPNDDGINDILTVFAGPDVAAVRSFYVFSRWGEIVFQRFNVRPGTAVDGWDGAYGSKKMDPAVFVYMVEVTYIDGREEVVKGDVVLVR